MTIGQRLLLAVLPAIIGLLTVAALAYWGNMYRSAPEWVVAAAAIAAVGSLFLAWRNTRYVARRIERLAGRGPRRSGGGQSPLAVVRDAARPGTGAAPDEIDSIEEEVDRLSSAVSVAEAGSRQREAAAAERIQEYASLLAEASSAVARQLDEVRLPIHILLENHFGQLNENQEEMLATAQAAAESAGVELRRLRDIAELDQRTLTLHREQIRVGELLHALGPQLKADGERTGVTVALDVMPGLPRVTGDRVRLQEAFELLLRHLVRHAVAGDSIAITASSGAGEITVALAGGPAPTLDADVALARRIIAAHGGTLVYQQATTRIGLPSASGPGTRG